MNTMFEVLYRQPRDLDTEQKVSKTIAQFGGILEDIDEAYYPGVTNTVTLTCVFKERSKAEEAELEVRRLGFHIEGGGDYPE